MFQTAFKNKPKTVSESFKGIKSITQPEQVLPLNKIISGLKNGTIFLPQSNAQFDIPEHVIDVQAGDTPEQTNANVAAATAADLAESAASHGEIITAAPGFVPEDAQPLVDAIEAALINADGDGVKAAATQSKAADQPSKEALSSAAEDEKAATTAA